MERENEQIGVRFKRTNWKMQERGRASVDWQITYREELWVIIADDVRHDIRFTKLDLRWIKKKKKG